MWQLAGRVALIVSYHALRRRNGQHQLVQPPRLPPLLLARLQQPRRHTRVSWTQSNPEGGGGALGRWLRRARAEGAYAPVCRTVDGCAGSDGWVGHGGAVVTSTSTTICHNSACAPAINCPRRPGTALILHVRRRGTRVCRRAAAKFGCRTEGGRGCLAVLQHAPVSSADANQRGVTGCTPAVFHTHNQVPHDTAVVDMWMGGVVGGERLVQWGGAFRIIIRAADGVTAGGAVLRCCRAWPFACNVQQAAGAAHTDAHPRRAATTRTAGASCQYARVHSAGPSACVIVAAVILRSGTVHGCAEHRTRRRTCLTVVEHPLCAPGMTQQLRVVVCTSRQVAKRTGGWEQPHCWLGCTASRRQGAMRCPSAASAGT